MIPGNDTAGEKVMVDPKVVEKPRVDEKTKLTEKFPGICPTCVVTRSMEANKEAIKEQGKEKIGISGSFLEKVEGNFEERKRKKWRKP